MFYCFKVRIFAVLKLFMNTFGMATEVFHVANIVIIILLRIGMTIIFSYFVLFLNILRIVVTIHE